MKIYAYHDAAGNIHSLVSLHAPEGFEVYIAPKPGEFVSEIVGLDLKPESINKETLKEIARTHTVSSAPHHGTLVKKDQKSS